MRSLALVMVLVWAGCWRNAPTIPQSPIPPPATVAPVSAEDPKTPAPPRAQKSVAIAGLLPLGTTAAGCFAAVWLGRYDGPWSFNGVVGASLAAVVPSAGRLYVGDPWNIGMLGTVGGMTMFVAGAGIDDDAAAPGGGFVLALFGLGVYATGALYQIISAPVIAYRLNEHARSNVSLLPHPITTPTSVAPGVSLIGVW